MSESLVAKPITGLGGVSQSAYGKEAMNRNKWEGTYSLM